MESLTVLSPGDIWECLKTFLVVTNGGGDAECAIGNLSVEDKNVAKYSTMHGTAPTTKNYQAQHSYSAGVEKP